MNKTRLVIAVFVVFFLGSSLHAQRLSRELFKNGASVKNAFREVIQSARDCTVRILRGEESLALGTVVGSDGWVMTKASELTGKLRCELKDGRVLPARRVGVNEDYDLALLKIDTTDLPIARWADRDGLTEGQWVITPGLGSVPISVGIVSVSSRTIPEVGGFLGVMITEPEDSHGPRIAQVIPETAADRAGLRPGDTVTHAAGERVRDRESLVTAIQKHKPGTVLDLTVRRDDRQLELHATVGRRENSRPSQLVGLQSLRRSGFPHALQHDSVLLPYQCGGPLLNLKGETVGINIARGGRTESYAIPAPAVLKTLKDLLPEAPEATVSPRSPEPRRVVFE